jgi:hypothetical protein
VGLCMRQNFAQGQCICHGFYTKPYLHRWCGSWNIGWAFCSRCAFMRV